MKSNRIEEYTEKTLAVITGENGIARIIPKPGVHGFKLVGSTCPTSFSGQCERRLDELTVFPREGEDVLLALYVRAPNCPRTIWFKGEWKGQTGEMIYGVPFVPDKDHVGGLISGTDYGYIEVRLCGKIFTTGSVVANPEADVSSAEPNILCRYMLGLMDENEVMEASGRHHARLDRMAQLIAEAQENDKTIAGLMNEIGQLSEKITRQVVLIREKRERNERLEIALEKRNTDLREIASMVNKALGI